MPAKQKQNFLSQLTPAKLLGWLLDLATWIGTFVIEGLWWIAQFLWWMCNFVGSLVLSLFGLVMGLLGKSKRKGLGKFAKNIQKKTSKHRAGVIGKLMSKPVRRRLLPGLAVVLLFLTGFAVYRSRQAPEAEAGWWNETWIYRRAIDLENPSSTVENAQIKVFDEEDLSTLVSDGKLQSDLSDLRFTDYSGNLLQYYVEDDTSAAAEFWILIPSLIEGESVIFMYYGNANADSASSSAWMADLGGEISYFEGHRVHAFLEDGSYLNYHKRNIEHVIVAGGGGGGSRHGGGGGAGGVVHNLGGTPLSINPQSYNIVVGNGGLGASAGSASADSTNGEDSIAFGLTAVGGGKGTSTATPGSGGSGGGSRGNNTYSSGGDGIEGQGNRGGRGNSGGSMMGGGGGGYSEPGKDADTPNEGDGGDGLDASTFFGTSYGESGWFAGGGGGGNTGSRGLGGQGGGGNGGGLDGDDGQLGVPNTGGGGGAGGHHGENRPGKPGGSGIVLVRYQSNVNTPTDITIGSPAVNEEISPGPVAYWKFDEGTGATANDASGQGNHGTITGATWQTKDQCIAGKCLLFNGNDEIEISENKIFDITEAISINLWVKPINITGRIAVLNHSSFSSESNGYSFEIHDGKLVLVINGGRTVGSTQKCNESIPINKFSQVSWTRDSNGTNKLYVNGKECTYESTITNEQSSVNTTLGIGSRLGKQNLPPFTDYSNKNYSSPYSAGCWGGDAATITYYPDEGYNNLSYKKLTKTAGGTGGCSITEHSSFPIENSKSYIVSAWMRANQTVTLNGYALDLNRGSDNAYRTGVTPVLNTSWQRISWIYDSGLDHAGDYQSRQIIYVNENLPLDVYWSDFQVEDITGTNYSTPSQNFYGYLDEVKIYSYARSAEQIKADYAAGLAGMSTPQGASATHGSYSPSWMSDGLVGYWKMDEASWNGTSGEVIDASGNNNHGTAVNGAIPGVGKFGNGGVFDGSSKYLTVPYSRTTTIQTETISAWIYRTGSGIGSFSGIVNIGSPTANPQSGINTDDTHQAVRCNGSYSPSSFTTDSTDLPLNTWTHVACIFDYNGEDLTISLHKNGEKITEVSQAVDSYQYSTNSIRTGVQKTDQSRYFNGSIDEVRIYNRALSPAEVKALYEWTPGPIAHYTFDSGDNNTLNDVSGYGNNGTWYGSTASRYTSGKYGNAGVFNGTNDYVEIGNPSIFNFSTENFSIGAWIKFSSGLGNHTIAGKYCDINSPGYWLRVNENKIVFRISDGGGSHKQVITNGTYNDNSWHHVFVSAERNGLAKIYINGTEVKTGDISSEAGSLGTGILSIGRAGTSYYYDGLIDDVRIYNYARTQKQILEDMAGGPPGTASRRLAEPIAHWRFDEGYGTTAHDAVGNNHGTFGAGAAAPTWTNEGKIGKALSFDGSSDYVDMGNVLNMGSTQDFSLTAWFKTDGTGTDRDTIINKGSTWWWSNATSNGYGMGIDCDWCTNCFCGSISDGTNIAIIESPQSVTDNKWHHGVITVNRQSQAMKLYLDGQLLDTTSISSIGSLDNTYHLVVSKWRHNQEQRFFHGLIDEVKIYNYALTPEEVKLDYNQGASTIMGVMGTDDTGQPTQSASAEYCIPGDTSHCAPPVARWDFEEGSGATAHDRSGNNNHGTLVNNPSWVTGKVGKALEFDGGNKVTFSNNLQITGNQPRTISAWFKTNDGSTGTSNFSIITGHGTTSTGNRFDFGVKDNKLAIGYWGSYTEGLLTINNNEWYHTAVVYDGTNTELFLNGVSDIKEVVVIDTPLGPPIIGDRGNDGHFFNGLIDQVRIYDYARTPAQVAWDYNRGAPIGHWRFDECQGNTAHDSSGNGNHGAINIGDSGSQTSAGTCTSDNSTYAWFNGRDGRINSALSFDGSDDHVNAGTNSVLNTGDTITYSAWVKLNSLSTETNVGQCIAGSYNPGYIFSLRGTSAGGARLSLRPHGGSGSYPTASEDLEVGKWHHVVGTHDGIAVRVYVDGIEKASNTYTNATNQARMIIGRASWSTSCALDGLIDDVKIYNYALTAEQVKILYNDGSAVKFGN